MIKKLFIFAILLINATAISAEDFNYSFYPKKSSFSKTTHAKKISEINRPYIRKDRLKRLKNAPLPVQAEIHSGVQRQQDMDPEVYMARKTAADNFKEQNDNNFNKILERLKLKKSKSDIAVFPKNAKTTIITKEVGTNTQQKKSPIGSVLSIFKKAGDNATTAKPLCKKPYCAVKSCKLGCKKACCAPKSCGVDCKKACCSAKSCKPGCKKACSVPKSCGVDCKKACCSAKSCKPGCKKACSVPKSCGVDCKKACCSAKSCKPGCEKACCSIKSCESSCKKACCTSNKTKRKNKTKKFTNFLKKLVTPSK